MPVAGMPSRLSYGTVIDREAAIDDLTAEGLDVTEWRDDAGTVYDEHAHPHREVRIVLEGSMTIWIDDVEHELGPGDRIELEAMQRHSAEIGLGGCHYLAGSSRAGSDRR